MADQNKKKTGSDFLVQGSILAVAGIVVRIIGMIYRIPFIRIVGDEGNGYYSVAFEIYNIILILSSYAFPTAVSKIMSAKIANDDYKNAGRILKSSLIYATIIGGVGCIFMILTAGWFAESFFMLPLCKYALLALAPTVWIMAYLGIFRGFFQGQHTMVPTAVSQILEQVINALVSVGAAWFFYSSALKAAQGESIAASKGAMGGTIGTGAGALTALIVLLILFAKRRSAWKAKAAGQTEDNVMSKGEIGKLLLITIIPIALSQLVYNINTIIDSKFFSTTMITAFNMGASEVASQYGAFTGRFKTIINVPIAISNAIGLSLVPTLSAALARGDKEKADDGISRALRYISLIAFPASIGLTVLGGPIIGLLFGKSEIAANMTIYGSFAILFTSISTLTNAVLHGSGYMNRPMYHALIALGVHLAALIFMLRVCKWGVYSLVIANVIFAICVTVLNAITMRTKLDYKQEYKKTYLMPLLCAAVMGIAVLVVRLLLEKFVSRSNLLITAVGLLVAVIVYAVMVIVTKTLSKEELRQFPVIKKFVK